MNNPVTETEVAVDNGRWVQADAFFRLYNARRGKRLHSDGKRDAETRRLMRQGDDGLPLEGRAE